MKWPTPDGNNIEKLFRRKEKKIQFTQSRRSSRRRVHIQHRAVQGTSSVDIFKTLKKNGDQEKHE